MNDSFEHYGVKGMKWGKKKKKNTEDYLSTSFLDTTVAETPAWTKAHLDELFGHNKGLFSTILSKTGSSSTSPLVSETKSKSISSLENTKSGLQSVKKQLYKIGGKPTASLNQISISVGKGALSSMTDILRKKIKV